jgi:peroxiredoxin
MAVEVGQEAPDFTLKNTAGEQVSLSDFRGRNVVLLFYPAAFSGVCTKQFTHIGETEARYAGENAQVIGISVDGFNAQRAFAQQLGLTDTILLSDSHPKGATATAYGTYWEKAGISTRAAFVIDKDGVVRSASVLDSPGDMPDEEEYFSTLATCTI